MTGPLTCPAWCRSVRRGHLAPDPVPGVDQRAPAEAREARPPLEGLQRRPLLSVHTRYNSCGNRHCPKCQATASARWLEAQAADLLDTPYFHVVFSLPGVLAPLASRNPRVAYGLLMRAAAATLLEVAADPKHLGAEVGVLSVLHTWGQALTLHPHVHCVVTGGGLAPGGDRWVAGRADFFLPVRVLSRVFRGKILGGLRAAFGRGRLRFPRRLAPLARPRRFDRLIAAAARTDWVVYARPPFGGPATVLK